MRNLQRGSLAIAFLALAACGSTEKTVVVNPPPNSAVVVPANGDDPKVVKPAEPGSP